MMKKKKIKNKLIIKIEKKNEENFSSIRNDSVVFCGV